MPKRKTKKEKSSELPEGFINISFFGIWNREKKEVVFLGMNQEDVELEFDFEGYDDDTHALCALSTVIDVRSLEQLDQ